MGTLVCTVELDKAKGVTVKVENADDQITQTVVMDGTSITITVKGPRRRAPSSRSRTASSSRARTSPWTPPGRSPSSRPRPRSGPARTSLKLESTKDMTLNSSAKLTQSATQDAKLSSSANVAHRGDPKLAHEAA